MRSGVIAGVGVCMVLAFALGSGCGRTRGTARPGPEQEEAAPKKPRGTVLRVKYGEMKAAEDMSFGSSFAFQNGTVLMLVFRNYDAPATSYKAEPGPGRAQLTLWVRKGDKHSGLTEVTAGTYSPGVVEAGIVYPVGTLVFRGPAGKVGLGAYWQVNKEAKTQMELWRDISKMSIPEVRQMLEGLGEVVLTEVGRGPGQKVVGRMALGDEKAGNAASGEFSIPVVEKPEDF